MSISSFHRLHIRTRQQYEKIYCQSPSTRPFPEYYHDHRYFVVASILLNDTRALFIES